MLFLLSCFSDRIQYKDLAVKYLSRLLRSNKDTVYV